MRHSTWVLVFALAATGCDTFRGLDTVEDPGLFEPPADMATTADADPEPFDVDLFDAGGDGSGDVGPDADVGAKMDVGPPPAGCPRDRAVTLPWQGLRPLSPKSGELELPEDSDMSADVSLAAVGPGETGVGMFALAAVFTAPTYSAVRMILFDAPADISNRDDYLLADYSFPNVEFESAAVRGDVDARRFAFTGLGADPLCAADHYPVHTGYISPNDSGLFVLIENTSSPLLACDSFEGRVDIAGPFGPAGHVAVFRETTGNAAFISLGDDAVMTGPGLGSWTDGVAASRRELVLSPSGTFDNWLAWLPNGNEAGVLDLSTAGDVAVDWLFDGCHAVAGPSATTVAVSSVDCVGGSCDVVGTQLYLNDIQVGLVDIAAMPDGGFVVAYAAGADESDERVFLRFFDDAFQPVLLGGEFAHQVAGTGGFIEGLSVAVTVDDTAVVVGAAYTTTDVIGGDVASVEFASLRLETP